MNGKACRKDQMRVGQNQRMKDNIADFCWAKPTPHAEKENTFDLLSGCGGPSSLPSALRGRGSLDSPGVIISARPIGANRKQEKHFRHDYLCKKMLPAVKH